MSPEVRFNALGIPYVVEFANVTFRSPSRSSSRASSRPVVSRRDAELPPLPSSRPLGLRRDASASRSSLNLRPTLSRSTLNSDRTLAATASSETLACQEPEKAIDTNEDHGLYIRFATQLSQPPSKLSPSRIARLKYRIAKAVMAAGMDTSPSAELGDPMDDSARGRASISSIRSEDVETKGMPGSLFRGTYGQVMTALRAAGLTTVACKESATRLGALFVARLNEQGIVEFTKLTLWG
ncbi:hypothetical protein BN946_scf185007.g78 [Trametes cinnabarina]|uniref:Uncharacterized protein n=1 Tax=Pycnoporus cinnabarinus TaxID=5643 RepID=A0A060SLC1_PYCCI|nr:hypothetical protein BN946_scf185007.g78 [Trametes cinnabarina]